MTLNELLQHKNIDPKQVVALRHRPHEPRVRKVLPWLAAENPHLFNVYQQTQTPQLEAAMTQMVGTGYVASFIGHAPKAALFVGLYAIRDARRLTRREFFAVPECKSMTTFGWQGLGPGRTSVLWFDLALQDFYSAWKGRLIVQWPPPERSWWRRAHRNEMAVLSVLEDSALEAAMPPWEEIELGWDELNTVPQRWAARLAEWRGIYYIFDTLDGKSYVGSACGAENLLGRWRGYGKTGHGGNRLLRHRDPRTFRFSILQRVSPDLDAAEVVRLESTWKERLHTRTPFGLNDN
jgi:hypothetical protein